MTTAAVGNRDVVRSVARNLISPEMYRRGADLLSTMQVVRYQGVQGWRSLCGPARSNEHRRALRLRGFKHPIAFRPGTPDVGAIVQNLVRHEYGQLPAGLTPKLIIDGGGYIGDVALYFLNRYPHAHVVSLEPDAANLELARENLAPYGDRARLVPAGIWSHSTTRRLSGEFTGARLDTDSQDGVSIDCVDVGTLLRDSEHATIDILKLDIEGAEEAVITQNSDAWLARTRILIVEYHSAQITANCTRHLIARGFTGFRYRSLQYFFNRQA